MRRFRRGRGRFGRKEGRHAIWAPFWSFASGAPGYPGFNALNPGGTFSKWTLIPGLAYDYGSDLRLEKILLWLTVTAGQVAANTLTQMHFGFITNQETGTDPSPLHPNDDGWMDWMWTYHTTLMGSGGTAGPTFSFTPPTKEMPIEINVRRIIKPSMGLGFHAVNNAASNSVGCFQVTGRLLYSHG